MVAMVDTRALRARLPRPLRWLLAVCFASAVIVGLMGMHTISSAHGEPMTSMSAAADHGHQASPADPEASAGCSSCGSGGDHDALMMMCVLALLATLLLLVLPREGRWWLRSALLQLRSSPRPRPAPSRPPSLLELSISRT
jgi:hypothetical protein|tara:strand:+ start:15734 stop:16156 length:423 start_codon:yes stop_codon:yes gene_type:complete